MKVHDKLFINGAWLPTSSSVAIEVRNAATVAVIARAPAGTCDDVVKDRDD
jgi:acyl-CoA reductase-like NAD-dependent aldehyde dehydrogenase